MLRTITSEIFGVLSVFALFTTPLKISTIHHVIQTQMIPQDQRSDRFIFHAPKRAAFLAPLFPFHTQFGSGIGAPPFFKYYVREHGWMDWIYRSLFICGIIRSGSVYIGQIGHILDVAYRGVDLFLFSLLLLEIVWDECIGHSDTS